ncbi:MAG: M56 family metallopeptidase [Chitinophagaceae bacterium]|nr:MAG: M56 family metallopeptidase [Chitinophagaceae bacterium]
MIAYLITVSIIISGCFLFYKLLLHRETFYRLNRFILLGCLLLAFLIPFIPIPEKFSVRKGLTHEVETRALPSAYATPLVLSNQTPELSIKDRSEVSEQSLPVSISWANGLKWLSIAYLIGVAIFAVNFLIQLFNLVYRIYKSSTISDGPYKIVEITDDKAPCSFGNYILINPEKYDWDTYCQVLLHEKIHIKQYHTLDILIAEIAKVMLWFNPFIWKYRELIEDNLEFLTDNELIAAKKVEKNTYQLSLLKVSAPNFPLTITTNYNQSLLKKRVSMMNAKRSNVHTAWKYLFLMPLMLVLMSFLNQPQDNTVSKQASDFAGNWLAKIKGEQVLIQLKNNDDQNANSIYFPLSQIEALPTSRSFKLVRDAGTMTFTGKFEQGTGMGTYHFLPNRLFSTYLKNVKVPYKGNDLIDYFLVNVDMAYIKMLKAAGYTSLMKMDLVALAALNVDSDFIKDMRNAIGQVEITDLISLKTMNITPGYIKTIKAAGYADLTASQIIAFKAQGIDSKYISQTITAASKATSEAETNLATTRNRKRNPDNQLDELSTIIKENINAVSSDDVAAMNAIAKLNYSNISAEDMEALKALRVDLPYVKSFENLGFKNLPLQDVIILKANNITAETVKEARAMGYPKINLGQIITLKALGITSTLVDDYRKLGYPSISVDDIIALRSTRVTPAYIQAQKNKGYDFKDVRKYMERKTINAH